LSIGQKQKSPNIYSIYVQAMEILSAYILAFMHVINPPYHHSFQNPGMGGFHNSKNIKELELEVLEF